jgi:hypothetical protein
MRGLVQWMYFFLTLFGGGDLLTSCEEEWYQIGSDIYGEDDNSRFGDAVSISDDGTMVAIGAPLNNGGAGTIEVYS